MQRLANNVCRFVGHTIGFQNRTLLLVFLVCMYACVVVPVGTNGKASFNPSLWSMGAFYSECERPRREENHRVDWAQPCSRSSKQAGGRATTCPVPQAPPRTRASGLGGMGAGRESIFPPQAQRLVHIIADQPIIPQIAFNWSHCPAKRHLEPFLKFF